MSARKVKFVRASAIRYVQPESGIELICGIDDGGIEWCIWTAGMREPLGSRPTLNAARAYARELLSDDAPEWARKLIEEATR